MDIVGVGRSDTGLRRQNNEDAFLVRPELGLYAVSDGMGGHAAGEVASELAISTIERVVGDSQEVMVAVARDGGKAGELVRLLSDAVRQACRDVYNRATADSALAGMGCTATALLVAGTKAAMAHVGDTRLYLVRDQAHQMSSDHTLAAELYRQGTISYEESEHHPHRHVLTRALGPQHLVDVETLLFDVAAGDRMVLCSDGFGDYLPSAAWLAEQVSDVAVEDLPDVLVDFANDSGGADNITVVAIEVAGDPGVDVSMVTGPHLALETLGSSFLLQDLSLAQLSRVLDRCETRRYEPGDIVWRSGQTCDELLVIVSGLLRIDGTNGLQTQAGPGQHLGESLLLRPRPIRSSVVAINSTDVLALGRANLGDLAARRPWLGVTLLSRLAERLSADVDRLAEGVATEGPLHPNDLL